jgi:preprotein translocase subunit SecA
LAKEIKAQLGLDLPVAEWAKEEGIADEEIVERITKAADEHMAKKAARFGPDIMRAVEKQILLQTLDHLWREHLATLDHLRSVVGFRGYAQRDPLNEYKTEGFELFQNLLASLRRAVTGQLAHVEVHQRPAAPPPPVEGVAQHTDPTTGENAAAPPAPPSAPLPFRAPQRPKREAANPATWGKVGRNEACPCGSGKKYKQCHGALVA